MIAANQGYQSGSTAFPVSFRPSLQGNTVTYAFNPMFSQSAAWSLNPAIASTAANPMMNQSMAWAMNPAMASTGLNAWNPLMANTGFNIFNPMMTGTGINAWNSSLSTAQANNIYPGTGISWPQMINPMQAMSSATASGTMGMGINTIQGTTGLTQMRVDLHETNSDVVVAAELPNISLNDLNLTVTDDSLSISATAFAGNRATSLFRTMVLPTSIRSEQVEATYANGILEIRAPKSDLVTRRKVKVNVL